MSKHAFYFLSAWLLVLGSLFAANPREQEGNRNYEQGHFAAAVTNFLNDVSPKSLSPAELHNLGLAYSQMGARGKALYCLIKAVELDPHDARIRKSCKNEISLSGSQVIGPFSSVFWASGSELFWLSAGAAFAAAVVAAFRLTQKKSILGGAGFLALLLWFVILAVQLPRLPPLANRNLSLVSTRETEMRNGPLAEASTVKIMRDGQVLKILNRREGWLQVEDAQNAVGWVKSETVLELAGWSGLNALKFSHP